MHFSLCVIKQIFRYFHAFKNELQKTRYAKTYTVTTHRLTVLFFRHVRHVSPLEFVQRPFLNSPFSASEPGAVRHVHTELQNVVHRLSYLIEIDAFRCFRFRKESQVALVVALLFSRTDVRAVVDAIFIEVQFKKDLRR